MSGSSESRRTFLLSVGAAAASSALIPSMASGLTPAATASPDWLATLKGKKHKQLFDIPSVNDGFGLAYAANFLDVYNKAFNTPDSELGAVVVVRHLGATLAVGDNIWAKYKLGTVTNVNDPKTKAPADYNRWRNPREGDLPLPNMQLSKLQARGVIVGVCDMALTFLSMMTAQNAGVSPEDAKKEWVASLPQGAVVVPVGVVAVNQAQEHGCTYCFGG